MTLLDRNTVGEARVTVRPLRLVALGGALDVPSADVALRALRHRFVLAHYLFFLVMAGPVLVVLPFLDGKDPFAAVTVLATVAGVLVVVAYVALAAPFAGPSGRIWLSPALLLATAVMQKVGLGVQAILGEDEMGVSHPLVWLVHYAALEGIAALLLRGPMRRAVAVLAKGRAEAVKYAVLMLGGVPVSPLSVLRLEADGNRVIVVTQDGRYLVPGPFAAACAAMQGADGMRVHRSHWIARAALHDVLRTGRALQLELIDGTRLVVPEGLRAGVARWLERPGGRGE